MSLSAADTEKQFTGNGVSTAYALPAEIQLATDFEAQIDGVVTSSYTLTGLGSDTGVTCTFDSPPDNGAEIVLRRNAPYDRTLVQYAFGDFNPETLNGDFDRAVMLIQQLATLAKRTPRGPVGDLTLGLDLDPEASKLLAWSSDARSLVNVDVATVSPASLIFTAIGQALAVAADAAAGRTVIGATSQADVDASIAAQLYGRNRLINGAMAVNQRQAASVSMTTAGLAWVADRWQARSLSAASGTLTASQQASSVPTAAGDPRYSIRLARTAGTYAGSLVIEQVLERADTFDLTGRQLALSCKIKKGSAFSGTGVRLIVCTGQGVDEGSNLLATGGWSGGVTLNVATTVPAASIGTAWATFSGVITAPTSINCNELAVRIEVQGLSGAGSANDWIEISDVQIEIASAATVFAAPPFAVELQRCQRFYEKSYSYNIAPGTATSAGAPYHRAQGTGGLLDTLRAAYKVTKRTVAEPVWYSTVTGATGQVRDTTASADVAITGTVNESDGFTGMASISAAVAGRLYEAQWAIDVSL